MNHDLMPWGVRLGEDEWLDLDAFAHACGVASSFVVTLVDEELVAPAQSIPAWRFGSSELARVRRICRLQHSFEANLASVAVMLDLLDQIDHLKAQLRRAGLPA